jgi:hypothetical protein
MKPTHRLLHFCRFAIVYVVLFLCASHVVTLDLLHSGFGENTYGNRERDLSLVAMMDGTAPKPFVYRSAFPKAVKWVVEQLPEATRARLYRHIAEHDSLHDTYFKDLPDAAWTPVTAPVYRVAYFGVLLSAFLSLLIVYKMARSFGLSFGRALGFLVAFSFVYSLTFEVAGYYYDFIELLGVLSACFFTLKRRLVLATVSIALFSLNKETFFLVPLALFFLLDRAMPLKTRLGWTGLQLALCIATRLYIMHGYDANGGAFVEQHLWSNLRFWVNPMSYLKFHRLFAGNPTPGVQTPLVLIPLAVFFRAAWRRSPAAYRRYLLASALPLAPLFIFFGFEDEFRALALAFPALVLIALHGATSFGEIFEPTPRPATLTSRDEAAHEAHPELEWEKASA